MVRFVLKTFLFVLLMFVLDLCAGKVFLLRNHLQSGTAGRINHVVNNSDEDILILGSSRAEYHINSKILEDTLGVKVFNMGVHSNGVIVAHAIAEMEFKRHKPKLVIFELTPSYDFTRVNNDDNSNYIVHLKSYYDIPEVNRIISKVNKTEYLRLHSYLYRLNGGLYSIVAGLFDDGTMAAKGYNPKKTVLKYEPTAPKDPTPEIDPIKVEILNSFIENLENQGIEILFTITPIYSFTTQDYGLLKKYIEDKGYEVLDYTSDAGFKGNKKYFNDRVHLNEFGADSLTSDLASRIKAMHLLDSK